MAVFKKYKGKRLNAKDKDWHKGTWYIWKRINGRIIHRSLKDVQTKEQAEIAERYIIEQSFNRHYGLNKGSVRFSDFASSNYARYVEQNNVNRTAKSLYILYLTKRLGGKVLSEITPQDCRDAQYYFQTMRTPRGKLAPASVNRIMSTLSKIFSLACEEGILDRNPMQYVKSLKEPPPRSRLLTVEEKERLWKELTLDSLLCDLVTLAINLPLRRGQILAITPDAIDFERGFLLASQSKNRASRMVPLNNIALNTLRDMLKKQCLPFPLTDFRRRWQRVMVASGINKKDGKRGENFTFHDLRKEFASELIRKNVNPNIVQKLFAHSDMSITNVYMHSEMDELKAAVNTLDATELQHTQEIDGPPN